MKKIFGLLASLMSSILIFAGDIIVTRDSRKIDAKILEVSKSVIKYKEQDNLDGPIFVLEISEISSVIYSNGKVQLYESEPKKNEPEPNVDEQKVSSNITNKTGEQTMADVTPDIIHLLSGATLTVKVQDVKQGILYYKDWYNPSGSTMTLNISDILNVQYANGSIQVYNQYATSNSVVVKKSATTKPKYITRAGNKYIYDGRTMQGRVFNNSAYSKLLETECESAYKKFQTGVVVAACGWGFFIGGVTMDVAFSWWAPYTGYVALVAEVTSIPLLITGYCQMHKSAEIFNMQCANNSAYSWSINYSKDGIGLAFNF